MFIWIILLFLFFLSFLAIKFPSAIVNQINTLVGFILGFIGILLGRAIERIDSEKKEKRTLFSAFIEETWRNLKRVKDVSFAKDQDIKDHFELDAWHNLKVSGLIREVFGDIMASQIENYGISLMVINKEIDIYFAFKEYFFQNNNSETKNSLNAQKLKLIESIDSKYFELRKFFHTLRKELEKRKLIRTNRKDDLLKIKD